MGPQQDATKTHLAIASEMEGIRVRSVSITSQPANNTNVTRHSIEPTFDETSSLIAILPLVSNPTKLVQILVGQLFDAGQFHQEFACRTLREHLRDSPHRSLQ